MEHSLDNSILSRKLKSLYQVVSINDATKDDNIMNNKWNHFEMQEFSHLVLMKENSKSIYNEI